MFLDIVLILLISSLQLFFLSISFEIILLITLLTEFLLCNSDTHKFISPKNLKRSKLGSFGLHQKILKLCFINMSFLSFSLSES